MAWTYEQNFNALNDGDLNGQDSWSGGTGYDVQTSVVYEGAKAVIGDSTNQNIDRAITAVSAGTVYFAMRHNGTSNMSLRFLTGGSNIRFQVTFSSSNITVSNGAGTVTLVTGYGTSQFYLFEVTFNSSNQHVVRVHDGTSWSLPTATLTATNNGDVDTIRINQGATGIGYVDLITPTQPTTSTNTSNFFQIL